MPREYSCLFIESTYAIYRVISTSSIILGCINMTRTWNLYKEVETRRQSMSWDLLQRETWCTRPSAGTGRCSPYNETHSSRTKQNLQLLFLLPSEPGNERLKVLNCYKMIKRYSHYKFYGVIVIITNKHNHYSLGGPLSGHCRLDKHIVFLVMGVRPM